MKKLIFLLVFLSIGCTKQQFIEIFVEWPRVENPDKYMVKYGNISKINTEAISVGYKPSYRHMRYVLEKDPYVIKQNKDRNIVAWKTDHRDDKYRFLIVTFHKGVAFGIDHNIDDYPEIKKAIAMGMIYECGSNGLNPLTYKYQIGGGDM